MKIKLPFVIFGLFIFGLNLSKAQTTYTIGTQTVSNGTTTFPAPYGNINFGSKHQILYRASELTSAGLSAGSISSLAFRVVGSSGATLNGFTIKMAPTTLTVLSSTFATPAFSTVYGPVNYTSVVGWNTHTFNSSFFWNGTSNVIVEVCYNNTNATLNAQTYYSNVGFNGVAYASQNTATVCSATAATVSVNRPTIQFVHTPQTTPPSVNFSANKTFSCTGTINFTDASCCGATSWLWNFGDGTTSTAQNPSHNYTVSGTYPVTLTATNAFGSNTLVKNNYVVISLGAGPIAATCISSTTSYCCGFGITNVSFNGINNTTADAVGGYQDYTCTSGTTVLQGMSYPISVNVPQPAPHNVMVWIDYNNNGIFEPATELAYSATSTNLATGNITIPSTAIANVPLRMRVSADFEGNALPTPCGNLEYGQAEDYTVYVISNSNPPVSNFDANQTVTCTGNISFNDLSTNIPTSWDWNFGDGNISSLQNPSHSYATSGVYTVTLTVTNAFGSNTYSRANYINVTIGNSPIAAVCSPPTTGYCCGYGIYNFTLNTINNTTSNGVEGYRDFACTKQTTLTQGIAYNFSIQTNSTDPQDTRVWADLNNNGVFDAAELIFSSNNSYNPTGTITLPATAVLNTPLRLRVYSDYAGSNPTSCANATYGQVEDYTVFVVPDVNPPVADFTSNKTSTCDGIIAFSDLSTKIPTSWLWNFGDGTTATTQNTTHTYTATGVYTVTLTATNAYGSNTIIKTNYINVFTLTGGPINATCSPSTTAYCCGYGIYNVSFGTINNTTANGGSDGYKDYTCAAQTNIVAGQNNSITIRTGTGSQENVRVWIDYNNDGAFNATTELVFSSLALTTHTGNIMVPATAVQNTHLRMRVASDDIIPTSCGNRNRGQAEDYTITVLPNTQPASPEFIANNTTVNVGANVVFTDLSTNLPTSWSWTFAGGTPSTSTVQNPTVNYPSLGTYPVTLTVSNAYGSNTLVKTAYINVVSSVNMCTGVTTTTAVNGALYDSGGPTTNYLDNQNCSLLISPSCATSITLNITSFTTEGGFDYLRVYDGTNTAAPVLFNMSGTVASTSVTGSSGKLYITFTSDGSVVRPGFEANWTSVIAAAGTPPVADFSKSQISCTNFQFNDISTNCPTSWTWDFGDGTATSSLQNPSHNYSTAGIYTITLNACNVNGCNTLSKANFVTINSNIPVATTCVQSTTAYCCGSGVYNFTLGAINNTSADGVEGYKDYSCSQVTSVTTGQVYTFSVRTGSTNTEYVKIWIDYNNDGTFNSTNEQIFSNTAVLQFHNGSFTPPTTAVLSTPLRMRVASNLNTITTCANIQYGQAEDYTIIIMPNTMPPVVNYTAVSTTTCNGIIVFANTTTNATSYTWDFGDGTATSSLQNPSHTYATSGVYTITQTACNAYGCNTLVKPNYVNVSLGGPVTSTCIQSTTAYCCGSGVYNFTLGSINNTTANGIDGYKDYSCTQVTSVTTGQVYTFSVRTGSTNTEYVKIWIDYNNDGTFNSTNEQIFSNTAVLQFHNGSFTPPTTAVLSTPLRMRVASNLNTITTCANIQYGQAEDYTIIIMPNTMPPVVNYTAVSTTTCNGIIVFANSTTNATSYTWDFGDGTATSSLQNPSHTYATSGVYTITQTACNAYGCNTLVKPNYVNVSLGGPVTSTCIQSTTAYCCGSGVYNFTLGSINNTTANGIDGYKDYSCTQVTSVTTGQVYTFSVRTGPTNTEYVKIWIDYNNDGTFNSTNEQIFSNTAVLQFHNGSFTPPTTAVLSTPLRMRVASNLNTITTCANIQYGQAEDYTIIIMPNTMPPVVNYTAVSTTTCNGIIVFANTTTNATSYTWDFGDGTATSSLQNPSHTYATSGVYTITQTACNAYGCNTLVKPNYVNVSLGGPVTSTCIQSTTAYCCGYGIYNVSFGTINNTTANGGSDGYKDYTCAAQTNIVAGQNNSITIRTGTGSQENVRVWIDYNNDGAFNATTELVFSSLALTTHTGNIMVPATAVQNTPLRMRVASDDIIPTSCGNRNRGQAEDYTITVLPNTQPASPEFIANNTTVNVGANVVFTDLSTNLPTSWSWTFAGGTPSTSTVQNPTVNYPSLGTYPVTLTVSNAYGSNTLVKTAYINVVSSVNMCTGVTTTTAVNGALYDSGGPTTNYLDNQNCSLLISPSCATSITLNITSFTTEGGFDYLRVYDGTNTAAPVLFNMSGTVASTSVTGSSGKLYITFTSDGSVVRPGFEANWTSVIAAAGTPPVADFSKSQISCTNFQFNDISTNCPTSWTWDFGDGTATSSLQNPSHNYSTAGIYTITLNACNVNGCNTLSKANFVTINSNIPVATTCVQSTTAYCCGSGVYNFTLGAINNTSADGVEGYKDYSCSQVTSVTTGQVYTFSVRTGPTNTEYVKIWIDYNNDGTFNTTNEQIFNQTGVLQFHNGGFTPPVNAVLNTPLRMRVTSDYNGLTTACTNVTYGQAEDYTIIIMPNTNPPVANFNANTTVINQTGTVAFTDASTSIPTSWSWTFAGGTPATSTVQNPSVVYNTLGTYPVTLTASNAFGTNTIVKNNYINVVNSTTMCVSTFTSAQSGNLFDSGGPAANYNNNENCSLLIDPGCALSVTLSFTAFNTQSGSDYLRIYNGTSTAAPLILTATGTTMPANITASSGKMFVVFTSNGSTTNAGFQASWTSVMSTTTPVASFTISNNNPPAGTTINFTDNSTNAPIAWLWDFGNAVTSTLQNPTYAYPAVGTYTVTLTAQKCALTSVTTKTVVVTAGPDITINPTSYTINLTSCHSTATRTLTIGNIGASNLSFDLGGGGYGLVGDSTILVIQDANAWGLNLAALISTNYGKTPTVITSAQIATHNFLNYDLIITVGDQSTAYYTAITNNKAKFEAFVNAGGIVQHDMGLQSGSATLVGNATATFVTASQNTVTLASHPIVAGMPVTLNGNSASHANIINLPTGTQVISTNSTSGLATTVEYDYGQGKVIATGMTWEYLYNNIGTYPAGGMLTNSIEYALSLISATPAWLTISTYTNTVSAGNTTSVTLTFNANGLAGGQYTTNLIVESNDPANPLITVPCTLNVPLKPCVSFASTITNSCNGIIPFTNTTLSATSYSWRFGDGNTSGVANPTHTYLTSGVYTVTLIACNANGCDTLIKPNFITITSDGPIATTCVQSTTTYCCGSGVYNFTLGSINNTTNDGVDGYKDYSCTQLTSVTVGQVYTFSVRTGVSNTEYVKIWIDYNNDGTFNSTNEQVFSDAAVLQYHNGNFTPPATAVLNTPLRMRVASNLNAITTCANIQYGQAEDYTILIKPNTVPPVVNYTANNTTTCNGIISFINTTTNATSYTWNFGDGTATSSLQNPSHTYLTSGVFTITQTACNVYGCNTLVKPNYINVSLGGAIATTCIQSTTAYCCGIGIYNVSLGTINNTSADAFDGYKDYSCTQLTSVTAGTVYTFSVTTNGTYTENVKIWIDYNNDGTFNTTNEQIYTHSGMLSHTGNFTPPITAVLNTPLRMRVTSDYNGLTTACTNLTYGQAEDYTIVIRPNTVPPVTNFIANTTSVGLGGVVNFTDLSTGAPTSWSWTFAGGTPTTSNVQNPTISYNVAGTYAVTLTATNAFGANTMVKTAYITVVNSVSMCSATTYTSSASGVLYDSGGSSANYNDSENCSFLINPTCALSVTLNITSFSTESGYDYLTIYNGANTSAPVIFSASGTTAINTITASSGKMFITFTSDGSVTMPGFAANWTSVIASATAAPVVDFTKINLNCYNFQFNDVTTNCPTSWTWNFGDGNTSTQQNPLHAYTTSGVYTVTLTACNSFGCQTVSKPNFVNINTNSPIPSACVQNTSAYCCGIGIYNFDFENINNTTADGVEGYKDYSCSLITSVTAGSVYTFSVETSTTNTEDVKIWIDYNNDGVFNTTNEEVFAESGVLQYHSGSITPPATAVLNTPLRMRVTSDAVTVFDACSDLTYGQAEDYTIVIMPNNVPPTIDFSASNTSSCNGIISFVNSTTNATSYTWNFGDGTTSILQNPSHTYLTSGVYTITQTACNVYGCNTLVKPNYVSVSLGGPIATTCVQSTSAYCCTVGIYNVTLNSINNTSNDGVDGYQDYSCTQITSLTAGSVYTFTVTTSASLNENVKIWIDYNNDGTFNTTNEEVYTDAGLMLNHTGNITIPSTAVLNTPLRMRVTSDFNSITDACTDVMYGQAEDYTVVIKPSNAPPVANFTANTTNALLGSSISFTDLSSNTPTSWLWKFAGGTPSISTLQNPTVVYNVTGTYAVTLTATNAFGSDDEIKTGYITITNEATMCSVVTTSNSTSGSIFDSGGAAGNYSSSENCSFLIAPAGCINSIELSFTQFDTQTGADYIMVYDGINTSAPLLLSVSGNAIPANVTATSGKMFVVFMSNSTVNLAGFEANWSSVTSPLSANFSTSGALEINTPVQFSDLSAGAGLTNWSWNFGNGNSSTLQNPIHYYTSPGTYIVTLTVTNTSACTSTISQTVNITQVGISELKSNSNLLIYPNPTNDFFTVDYTFNGEKEVTVTLFNILGDELIKEKNTQNNEFKTKIDVTNIAKGAYFVKISTNTEQITKVIYVQ